MNRITTTSSDFERLKNSDKLVEIFEAFSLMFSDLASSEQEFIKWNIFSFESFFVTTPARAIGVFCFPFSFCTHERHVLWNYFVIRCQEVFESLPVEKHEKFLENFYEQMLLLTGATPSRSMLYRTQMREVTKKYLP